MNVVWFIIIFFYNTAGMDMALEHFTSVIYFCSYIRLLCK